MKHSSAELKMMSRNILAGKWGIAVGFTLLNFLVTIVFLIISTPFATSTNALGLVLYLIVTLISSMITGLFSAGSCYFYLNICRGKEYGISDLFAAFKMHPDRFLIVSLIFGIINLLFQLPYFLFLFTEQAGNPYYSSMISSICTLLSSIVSLILSLFFMASVYLMLDFPEMGAIQSMKTSARLMRGSKGSYLYLCLSFLGWSVLGLFSCGLALLWVIPYQNMTNAYFYTDVLHQLDDAGPAYGQQYDAF